MQEKSYMNIASDLFFSQQIISILFLVTNKLQMQGDKHLKDITIRQMLALPALFHAPDGKATINHIARQIGTTKQSAKQIVNAMKKKNYLSVTPSEQDKRAVNVAITEEGRLAFSKCSNRTDEFLANLFNNFSSNELEKLCSLLQKLYNFDGIEKKNKDEQTAHNAKESAEILQHHKIFAKLRETKYRK